MDELAFREARLRYLRGMADLGIAQIHMVRAARRANTAMERIGMQFAASIIESADLGEFDNRSHDWIRKA